MSQSDRKAQAIYDAVHEAVMQLRIALSRDGASAKLDTQIAQAGRAAAEAAVAAYRKSVKP